MKELHDNFVCPVCRASEYSVIGPYADVTKAFREREIVKCTHCNTISMYPCIIECEPEDYYESQYWTEEIFTRRSPALRAQAKARCLFMRAEVNFGDRLKVLDVGAGVGYMNWGFREVWPDIQTEYTAVEVNPAARKFLFSDPGVNHVLRSLDDSEGGYDVIVLSHILEHITDPVGFLSKTRTLFNKSSGYLLVEVPCLDFRFKKRNEPHVLFYSQESLSEIFTRNDFEVMSIATCGHPVWKKRADGGMTDPSFLLSLRRFFYQWSVRQNGEFSKYGGDRQWIRAICRVSK